MPSATPPPSEFLANIYRALDADWQRERHFIAKVAVMATMGCSVSQITEQLEAPPVLVRNAMVRLRRVHPQLIREDMQ